MLNQGLASCARTLIAAACAVLGAGACADREGCATVGTMRVCGDIPAPRFSLALAGAAAPAWPALPDGAGGVWLGGASGLRRIGADGAIVAVASVPGRVSVPSQPQGGVLRVVAGDGAAGAPTHVLDLEAATLGLRTPPRPIVGTASGTAVASNGVHDAVEAEVQGMPGLQLLPSANGVQVADGPQLLATVAPLQVVDAARPVVVGDGSWRWLGARSPCASWQQLVARTRQATVHWQVAIGDWGAVDLAPGPDGASLVVTAGGELRHIDADGHLSWTFRPTCARCRVAQAPTVTAGRLYVPVAIRDDATCTWSVWRDRQREIDPLYALDHAGQLVWIYDGPVEAEKRADFSGLMPMQAAQGPVVTTTVRRQPLGRPAPLADGRLLVAIDGGFALLGADGREQGRLELASGVGEEIVESGSAQGPRWAYRQGREAVPVVGADGRAWLFDGTALHALDLGAGPDPKAFAAPHGLGHGGALAL